MKLFEEINKQTVSITEDCYELNFASKALKYKSLLKGFNKEIYNLFDSHYDSLNLSEQIQKLFNGAIVNSTENQSAIHHAYRDAYSDSPNNLLPKDILDSCSESINTCIKLKNDLLDRGIKNIVTIGIGGSFEGPKLLIETLTAEHERSFNHIFLTGPDVIEFSEMIEPLIQEETFFIVSSKSFSTDETLQSIRLSKEWSGLRCDFANHFIAVTSQPEKAQIFGFSNKNIIQFPNEIGGRYSMWSPISLPAILELGEQFIEFLKGGSLADTQFLNDEKYQKFLKTLSYSDIWYNNFVDKGTRVLLTYSWKMRFFTDYAQQLEMESIGKQPNKDSIFQNTGQIVFGGFGSTAQHSYFQLLHQGTALACADIFTVEDNKKNNKLLFAQSQAQSNLLANGADAELQEFEKVNGNIPTNLFTLESLNSFNFGYLIATWEHRTFLTSQMLQINPFDQYGVSAGKIFTKKYLEDNGG
jgi:glucose-6-phosphate isomerase